MTRRRFGELASACVVSTMAASNVTMAGQPGGSAAAAPALRISGAVTAPLSLTPADFKSLPRTRVEVKEDGRTLAYEGVPAGEILKRAGAPLGAELRGTAVASYVVASGSDGYQAVFSLAELDPAFTSNDVIVADTLDGKPLAASQGPFRIVAPKDARASRSVRMLERLEVVRLGK